MEKIVFSGAAGNGISPLEQIMSLKGYNVYGTDHSFDIGLDSARKKALESVGITIVPQDGSAITPDTKYLCISAAVKDTNPDVVAARKLGIPIKYRSDLLKEILEQYSYGIAVGGTAGKTTTTAMIGYVLNYYDKKPCMVNGGALCNLSKNKGIPNFIYNEGDICVIEADESDSSIKKYYPHVGIINNISLDHTSIEKLIEYFTEFASHSQNIVVNKDCPYASKIKHSSVRTFSIQDPTADFYAYDITPIADGIEYKIKDKKYTLGLLGSFNVYNALSTMAACSFFGLSADDTAKALESFTGIKTRLEKMGSANNIIVYNDFAHNPSKIRASLSALKDYPGRVIAMYQPHTPFSAQNTGAEMAKVIAQTLEPNDIMILQEIYELTEKDVGVTSNNIVKEIILNGHDNALFLPKKSDTRKFLKDTIRAGDRVIIMGAHDNSLADFSLQILKDIAS